MKVLEAGLFQMLALSVTASASIFISIYIMEIVMVPAW